MIVEDVKNKKDNWWYKYDIKNWRYRNGVINISDKKYKKMYYKKEKNLV